MLKDTDSPSRKRLKEVLKAKAIQRKDILEAMRDDTPMPIMCSCIREPLLWEERSNNFNQY